MNVLSAPTVATASALISLCLFMAPPTIQALCAEASRKSVGCYAYALQAFPARLDVEADQARNIDKRSSIAGPPFRSSRSTLQNATAADYTTSAGKYNPSFISDGR